MPFALLFVPPCLKAQMQMWNDGVSTYVTPNASVYIEGSLKNSSAGGTVNNNGNIILTGNYVNDSIFKSGDSSYVRLIGASQNIGGSVSTTFNNLVIDGTADKTISISTNVSDSLIFNANHVKIGNSNLVLLQNAVHSGTTNSRFVVTNGGGSLVKKSVPLAVPGFLFPVGDSTISSGYSYKPAILNDSSISTVDTFAVKVAQGLLPTTGADPTCVQYTWYVQESNPGNSNVSLSLGWNPADEGASFHRDTAYMWQYKNSIWNLMSGIPGAPSNTPATAYCHKTAGITDFSTNDDRFIVRSYSKAIIHIQDTSQSVCKNNNNSVTFSVEATGSDIQYQWQQNCGSGWTNLFDNTTYSGTQTSSLTIIDPGLGMNGYQYQCIMENLLDTIISQPAVLTVHSLPQTFTLDTTVDVGNPVQLNASGGTSYQWSPSTYLNSTDIPNPVSTPLNNISYIITVTDGNGCAIADTINIIVDESTNIFVPKAFAPDGPTINQILYVRGKGIKELDFVIYDRWGEKVFEADNVKANDPAAGWNGTYNGKELSTAVFVYYVKATYYSGENVNLKGDVTLVR